MPDGQGQELACGFQEINVPALELSKVLPESFHGLPKLKLKVRAKSPAMPGSPRAGVNLISALQAFSLFLYFI